MKLSRKFLSTLLVMLFTIILRFFNKLDNMYFTIIILSAYTIYNVIEGTLDLKALKFSVKVKGIEASNETEGND